MEKYREIILELERFSDTKGMNYTKIAKAIGIGNSTLSEVRNGVYRGDYKEITEKIKAFLDRQKETMKRINFVTKTETLQKIFYAIELVKKFVASNVRNEILESAKIAYIIGRAGIGKTYALREYQNQYKAKTIFITAENHDTDNVVIRKIAKELRLDTKGRMSDIKENIKEKLRFTETIVIIDEGEKLKPKVIDIVRSIGDQTGIGLVICGTEQLKYQLFSLKGEYEYLYSRAIAWMTLNDLSMKDIDNIFREFIKDDISLYEEKDIVQITTYINKVVKGSARQMSNLLSVASDISKYPENMDKGNGLISLDFLKAAVTMLAIN